jgi:hypothetical protein
VIIGFWARAEAGVQPARRDLLAGAVLAQNHGVRFRRAHPLHQTHRRAHRGRLGDHVGYAFAAEALVLALQPETLAQRLAQFDLGLERGAEPSVVPRLLDIIAGATPHRLDRAFDAAVGCHHHDGERRVEQPDPAQKIEALTSGRRVPSVVEVHQDDVVILPFDRRQHTSWRADRIDGKPFGLEEEPESLKDVRAGRPR